MNEPITLYDPSYVTPTIQAKPMLNESYHSSQDIQMLQASVTRLEQSMVEMKDQLASLLTRSEADQQFATRQYVDAVHQEYTQGLNKAGQDFTSLQNEVKGYVTTLAKHTAAVEGFAKTTRRALHASRQNADAITRLEKLIGQQAQTIESQTQISTQWGTLFEITQQKVATLENRQNATDQRIFDIEERVGEFVDASNNAVLASTNAVKTVSTFQDKISPMIAAANRQNARYERYIRTGRYVSQGVEIFLKTGWGRAAIVGLASLAAQVADNQFVQRIISFFERVYSQLGG